MDVLYNPVFILKGVDYACNINLSKGIGLSATFLCNGFTLLYHLVDFASCRENFADEVFVVAGNS